MIGTLLVLQLSLALLGAGGTALWADRTQRDGGYVTTGVHEFSHRQLGTGDRIDRARLGGDRLAVPHQPCSTRSDPGHADKPGPGAVRGRSAPPTDVDRYLAGVNHTVITEFWEEKVEAVAGGPAQICSGNAGLLGRLVHGSGLEPGMGSDRRILDGRRDEC